MRKFDEKFNDGKSKEADFIMKNIIDVSRNLEEIENISIESQNKLGNLIKQNENYKLETKDADNKIETGIEINEGIGNSEDESNKIIIKKKDKEEYVRATFYLDESILNEIDHFHELSGIGKSELVRELLKYALDKAYFYKF